MSLGAVVTANYVKKRLRLRHLQRPAIKLLNITMDLLDGKIICCRALYYCSSRPSLLLQRQNLIVVSMIASGPISQISIMRIAGPDQTVKLAFMKGFVIYPLYVILYFRFKLSLSLLFLFANQAFRKIVYGVFFKN